MSQKKYASLTTLQTFLDNLKTTFASITHKHKLSDIEDYTVDDALSSTSTNPVQNSVLNAEFEAVKTDATNKDVVILAEAQAHTDTALDTAKEYTDEALDAAKSYTDTKTSDLVSTTTVDTKISTHNTSTTAHNDIRVLISDLTTKLNNFLDVDDTTTDQLSEVLTLINNNKGTLESLTTSKINVSDIVDNLTTNNTSKVLSAAQGVAIKDLIDALQTELDSKADSEHTHTVSQISDLTATVTELNYVDGVTSAIQTQLDGKAASTHYHSASQITSGTLNSSRLPTVPTTKGGTGATTVAAARTNLDVYSKAETQEYVGTAVADAETTLIGERATDTMDSNTIEGAKRYADYVGTTKADVEHSHSDYTTVTEVNDYINSAVGVAKTELIGNETTDDETYNTIWGAKAYTDDEIASAKEVLIGRNGDSDQEDTIWGAKAYADNSVSTKADKSTTLSGYGITNAYTKTEIDNLELITVADIDTICGSSIQVASADYGSVTF